MPLELILAQTDSTTASGGTLSLLPLILIMVVMWGLLIFPRRRAMKRQQELSESLAVGDTVQTIGGIIGRITSLDDDSAVIELESGRMRVTRRAISNKVGETA